MKKNYNKTLSLRLVMMTSILLAGFMTFGQTIRVVETTESLSDVINGDTTATGDRNDLNTIYELKMGGFYPLVKELSIGAKLYIRSEGGEGFLPAIYPQIDDSGNFPKSINNSGDVTLEGIYLSNKNGDDVNPKWGGFRVAGEGSAVVLKGCQFEFDKASTLQLNGVDMTVLIEDCIAAKSGNFKEYNGNGRLIDTRGNKAASIIVRNSTVYYMQDRLIRNMGGEIAYLELDHLTMVSNQGFHGVFAMAKVHKAKITNNLVIDGMYGGDHPNVAEQTSSNPDDNLQIYMITMDTVYEDTDLEISNNNIAFTQPVLDFFNSIDSISKPEVLSPTIKTVLGDKAADAYFEEAVEFTNMPGVPMEFLTSIYTDPSAAHPSNWPSDIRIDQVDAGYAKDSKSATASTEGTALGDSRWMVPGVGIFNSNVRSNGLQVSVYPNPVADNANFMVNLTQSSNVELYVYDVTGKLVYSNEYMNLASGANNVSVNTTDLANGLYLYSVVANGQLSSGKITLSK